MWAMQKTALNFASGKVMVTSFRIGVFRSKNGDVFEGECLNDMRCGVGIVTLASGKKMRQKWENERLINEEML
jgi:hypothetical protein